MGKNIPGSSTGIVGRRVAAWGRLPSRRPRELQGSVGTATLPPTLASWPPHAGRRTPPSSLTQTPPAPASLRGRAGAAPAPFTPARSSSVVSAAVVDGDVPPQIGSASSAELLLPRFAQLPRRRQLSIHKAGWDAPETAAVTVLRSSAAPTQSPVHPPISISPTLGPRNVPWCGFRRSRPPIPT